MKPRKNQLKAAITLINKKRAILHAYCGFGKTITSLYGAFHLGIKKPTVVCPANVVKKFAATGKALGLEPQVISWARLPKEYKNLSTELIIVDECHKIKNCSKVRTACLVRAAKKSEYLWLMSATPSKYRPSDLYMQIKLCGGHSFTLDEFRLRYSGGYRIPGKLAIIEGQPTNTNEFNAMLDKVRIVVKDDHLIINKKATILRGPSPDVPSSIQELAAYRKKVGMLKCYEFLSLAKNLERGVIFAHHLDVIHELSYNLKCDYLIGGMNGEEKQKKINKFLNDKSIKFLIVGITAGGEGIDIDGEKNAYFVEITYSELEDKQAYMRLVRSEKGHEIFVNYFLMESEHQFIVQQKRHSYLKSLLESA